ncbi:MAG: alcohol dehydrogenase [Claussenomyces sp. TS43310]|nr:MAG: alcohol dehydrogenase [Claussenomyces sp. TS43310]
MGKEFAKDIPETQWAQVAYQHGTKVEYKQIPVPKPGPDEVLINIKYSGVCHTDLHALQGDWPLETKMPLVGGHEGAGYVVALGDVVNDIKIGDKVGVKWINGSCLQCSFCMQADEPLCAKASLSGYTVDGSFQQYCIGKAAHVARLPPDCDLEKVAPVLCAGITVYKGIKESGVRPGQSLAIVGAGGGLGSLACQYAKAMGIDVIAIDGGSDKQTSTKQLGAAHYVDFMSTKDLVADVQACTPDGLGPHAALLVAANEKPFQQAAAYVRPRGAVVMIGLPAGAVMQAPVFESVVRMISIKGSYVGNRCDTAEALEFFNRGLINAPFKTVGLSKLQEVYDLMRENKIVGRYVVDNEK